MKEESKTNYGNDIHDKFILYKYQGISDRTLNVIGGKHYFATAKELNDPFECKFDLKLNTDLEDVSRQIYEWITSLSKRERRLYSLRFLALNELKLWIDFNYFPKRFCKKLISTGYRNLERLHEYKNSYLLSEIERTTGISCYSETCDNVLMFSHYGQQHKGICVGFEFFSHDVDGIFGPRKIQYAERFPVFNEFPSSGNYDEVIRATILTKAASWSYEKEWRCFTVNRPGINDMKGLCKLSSIVFGCRSAEGDQSNIRNAVNKNTKILDFSKHERRKAHIDC